MGNILKIYCYMYDDIANPWCGGGGAFRVQTVHEILAEKGYKIFFYCGNFPLATRSETSNRSRIKKRFLGIPYSYILSRVSFALLANIHALVCRCDIIISVFSVFSPVCPFLFRKNVITEFYHLVNKEPVKKYGIVGYVFLFLERIMLRYSRHFITMATGIMNNVKAKYPDKEIVALPCGFDPGQLKLTPVDNKYILAFGRLDIYMKGLDRLINVMNDVLKEFPEYRLVIAGRGDNTDIRFLHNAIEKSPIKDKIQLIINPNYQEKLELFRCCTYVAIFSRFEGWCIVAIEAAASGKAVLGTNIDGLRDSVKNGVTGILIDEFDEKMAKHYTRELIVNEKLRKSLEANARSHASAFSWESIASMQENIYRIFYAKLRGENK